LKQRNQDLIFRVFFSNQTFYDSEKLPNFMKLNEISLRSLDEFHFKKKKPQEKFQFEIDFFSKAKTLSSSSEIKSA